jgi:hypothetical protein
MTESSRLHAVAEAFQIPGEYAGATPYGNGHIQDSYCVRFYERGTENRYLMQRINRGIFGHPAKLMENIVRVTSHLAAQLKDHPDRNRRVLTLIRTKNDGLWHTDDEGDDWRAFSFIERTVTHESIHSPAVAYEAARAFGKFQKDLVNLPAPRLGETIVDFHHTPKRFEAMEKAIGLDACQRADSAAREIKFALARKSIVGELLDARLPERVTHNDTKLNNVLFDKQTGEAICVIDLDTVMPGLAPCDFGDMVRTATCEAREDERDLLKVAVQFGMFEALVRGYLFSAREFLTEAEKEQLVFAGKLITFEQGIRFLTDYLNGDSYYKVQHAGHNLDRCRTQFKLVESIESQEEAMTRLVRSI